MDIKKIFGHNVKRYRKALGLTQMQFAEIIDVDQKHVSFIEGGNSFPSAGLISKIAESFKISPDKLFEEEDLFSEEQLRQNILRIVEELSEQELKKIHNYASYIYIAKT